MSEPSPSLTPQPVVEDDEKAYRGGSQNAAAAAPDLHLVGAVSEPSPSLTPQPVVEAEVPDWALSSWN